MELIIQKNCQLLICLIGCILWAIILASGTLHVSRPEAMPGNVTVIKTKIVASRMQCSHLCARTKDCKFTAVTETATGEFKCDLLSAEVVEINPSAFEPSSPDDLQELSQVLSTQEWSPWSPWSVCSVSCGCGIMIKTRTCFSWESCNGTDQESRTCDSGVPCTALSLIGKECIQSSTHVHYGALLECPKAIDGLNHSSFYEEDISCMHTEAEDKPWWQVDLEKPYTILNVTILNRSDCCGERLDNFGIFLGNATDFQSSQTHTCQLNIPYKEQLIRTFTCDQPSRGRFLTVQRNIPYGILSICEISLSIAL